MLLCQRLMAQAEQHLAASGDMSVLCTDHHQKRTKLQPEKHLIWIFNPDKDENWKHCCCFVFI